MPSAMTTAANQLAELRSAIGRVIRGKDEVIELAIVALLARGHLLIEDVPGVGKTTLAQALARFLPLLLPAHPVHFGPAAVAT